MTTITLSLLELLAIYVVTAVLFMIVGALLGKRVRFTLTVEERAPRAASDDGDDDDGDDPDDGEFPPDDVPDPDDPVTVPDFVPDAWIPEHDPLSRDRWPLRSSAAHGGRHRLASGRGVR